MPEKGRDYPSGINPRELADRILAVPNPAYSVEVSAVQALNRYHWRPSERGFFVEEHFKEALWRERSSAVDQFLKQFNSSKGTIIARTKFTGSDEGLRGDYVYPDGNKYPKFVSPGDKYRGKWSHSSSGPGVGLVQGVMEIIKVEDPEDIHVFREYSEVPQGHYRWEGRPTVGIYVPRNSHGPVQRARIPLFLLYAMWSHNSYEGIGTKSGYKKANPSKLMPLVADLEYKPQERFPFHY